MNPEIRTRWVAALRSGDYKQGWGWLRSGSDEYCCLGVLCELAVEDGVIAPPSYSETSDGHSSDAYSYGGKQATPPEPVLEWAGLEHLTISNEGRTTSLIRANDILQWKFDRIADVIEEQL